MPRKVEASTSASDDDDKSNASGETDSEDGADEEAVPHSVTIVMLSMVLGYASMIGPLQHALKAALGIGQSDDIAHKFTFFASFNHVGKLIGYVGHNFIFACSNSIQKVYISMLFMFVGLLIPCIYVFSWGGKSVYSVLISYSVSGFGFGVFEVTFLSVITPLGKATKLAAVQGFPLGFAMINIVCPLLSYAGVSVKYLFWFVLLFVPLGIFCMSKLRLSPEAAEASSGHHGHSGVEQQGLGQSLMVCSKWLPDLLPQLLARFIVEFVMQNNPNYYIYNDYGGGKVPLWDPSSKEHGLLNIHLFFTLFGSAVFLGDFISRKVSFLLPLDTLKTNVLLLAAAASCSIVAFGLMAFDIAALAVFAIFLAFFGNGLMYGAGSKYIDHFVPPSFSLSSYSMWCFAGGIGSIAGAEMIDITRGWYCGDKEYPHVCLG